jgi:hypothetical protein
VDVGGDDAGDARGLGGADRAPAHAAQHRLAADAEIDDLADHGEDAQPGLLASAVLARRRRPDGAEPPVHRLEHAGIDGVERRRRVRKLPQHELDDLARLRLCDDEADHALHDHVDLRRRPPLPRSAVGGAPAAIAGPAMRWIVSTMKPAQASLSPSLPPK